MMPGVLLLMWGVEDRRVVLKLTAMLVPLFLSVAITGNGRTPWPTSLGSGCSAWP
jgi:hypothetical protein